VTSVFSLNIFFDVEIVDSFDLFPTLEDPRVEPALVADGPTLEALLNLNPSGPLQYPNELWFRGGEEAQERLRGELTDGRFIGQLVSFDELQLAQQKDPLVAAGWEGILFISFAAILILSAIGFLIYSYLTAQQRTLEFAVLRTMGFSKRQIAIVVGFEQVFVIGLGMIAGTLMGMRLGSLMIRYMGLTETGDEVLPPMRLEISWFTVGTAWLVLGVVFLVTIGAVVLLYSRLALHRVLRIGET
jgi:ABC-type antimicrobial peptide transport system permease subunit